MLHEKKEGAGEGVGKTDASDAAEDPGVKDRDGEVSSFFSQVLSC